MTPEQAVKELIAEIRADRAQRAADLKSFCGAIDARLVEFRIESKELRAELISLKFVLNDTRNELERQKTELRMVADHAGVTQKAGNGNGRKR